MEHWPTSATGTGWERTPWHATQRAALEALKKIEGKCDEPTVVEMIARQFSLGARRRPIRRDFPPNSPADLVP
jgi:hypothetical protein